MHQRELCHLLNLVFPTFSSRQTFRFPPAPATGSGIFNIRFVLGMGETYKPFVGASRVLRSPQPLLS